MDNRLGLWFILLLRIIVLYFRSELPHCLFTLYNIQRAHID